MEKGMTLSEIKTAIAEGKKVYWGNEGYEVILDGIGQYLIYCEDTQYCIGLTHMDGVTMNGKEEDFFIAPLCDTKIYSMEDVKAGI